VTGCHLALIQRERSALAEIASPEVAADAERRAAAIAELTKRAGLAVPIQNEATFLRAEALERLAVLVDEGQARGEINVNHRPSKLSESRTLPVPRQRIAEGRALAQTGAIEEARQEAEKRPDQPVSMSDILKRAKRRQREAAPPALPSAPAPRGARGYLGLTRALGSRQRALRRVGADELAERLRP